MLKTNRGFIKFFLLNLITLGIYSIVDFSSIGDNLNTVASKYDGKKTMHYCLMFFVLAPITFGVWGIVWWHQLSARIGEELARRGIAYNFSAGTYWGWNVLGCFIGVGPIVYMVKLFKAMNLLCEDYNAKG